MSRIFFFLVFLSKHLVFQWIIFTIGQVCIVAQSGLSLWAIRVRTCNHRGRSCLCVYGNLGSTCQIHVIWSRSQTHLFHDIRYLDRELLCFWRGNSTQLPLFNFLCWFLTNVGCITRYWLFPDNNLDLFSLLIKLIVLIDDAVIIIYELKVAQSWPFLLVLRELSTCCRCLFLCWRAVSLRNQDIVSLTILYGVIVVMKWYSIWLDLIPWVCGAAEDLDHFWIVKYGWIGFHFNLIDSFFALVEIWNIWHRFIAVLASTEGWVLHTTKTQVLFVNRDLLLL